MMGSVPLKEEEERHSPHSAVMEGHCKKVSISAREGAYAADTLLLEFASS